MEQTKASSLIDMANGAIKERLDYEMGRVIQNISDPNTKATAKRTITVKITLEPDEEPSFLLRCPIRTMAQS